jgi:hypothetical protein
MGRRVRAANAWPRRAQRRSLFWCQVIDVPGALTDLEASECLLSAASNGLTDVLTADGDRECATMRQSASGADSRRRWP